jgi:hypothetical protein
MRGNFADSNANFCMTYNSMQFNVWFPGKDLHYAAVAGIHFHWLSTGLKNND